MVGCIFTDHFCYCMVTVRQHWREAGKIHAHKLCIVWRSQLRSSKAVQHANTCTENIRNDSINFLKKHAITFQKAIVAALVGLTVCSYIWFPTACWQAALMDCKWGHAGLSAQLYTWLFLHFGHKLFFFFLKHHKHCIVGFHCGAKIFAKPQSIVLRENFCGLNFYGKQFFCIRQM